MAKMNLKEHAKGFDAEDQGLGGTRIDLPEGDYTADAVNVRIERDETSAGKKKLRVTTHCLQFFTKDGDGLVGDGLVVDGENAQFVGAKFWHDLWLDVSKAMNAKKLAYTILAHDRPALLDDFDPESDEHLQLLTARPYRVSFRVKKRVYEKDDGSTGSAVDVDLLHLAALTKEQKAVYNTPEWPRIVGDVKDRVGNAEKRKSKGGGRRAASSAPAVDETPAADPFASDDLPF